MQTFIKAGVVTLISNKSDFNAKKIIRLRGKHYKIIKKDNPLIRHTNPECLYTKNPVKCRVKTGEQKIKRQIHDYNCKLQHSSCNNQTENFQEYRAQGHHQPAGFNNIFRMY